MPWREMLPMDQRMQFVTEFRTGLFTMTELAAQYGISRKTGYKWIDRYEAGGVGALSDHSRRPEYSPAATAPELVEALVALRKRRPRWGAKKLLAVLRRQDPDARWPARSTVCDLLKQRGLIAPQRKRFHAPGASRAPLVPITAANEVWTTDFKGEFRTGDGRYCYPLTLRDGFSRYVLRCDALLGRTTVATRDRFARAFAEYGLPERIRSDNGGPFASPGVAGLSQLSVWWIRLGIVPERTAPGHPEQNGSHEQFHRVLKAATTRPPAVHAAAQQRRFARFCAEYNDERPHEALQDEPPAQHYRASPRAFPRQLPALEYPGQTEVRLVGTTGGVSWGGEPLFLATALAGEYVAFEEVDDGLWTIFFATVALARFDERHRRIHPLMPVSRGRSAASLSQQSRSNDRRQAAADAPSKRQ